MRSRREFIQLASVSAMLLAAKSWSSVAAKQKLNIEDLLDFDTKGQVTLLHLTDLHGQLNQYILDHLQKTLVWEIWYTPSLGR